MSDSSTILPKIVGAVQNTLSQEGYNTVAFFSPAQNRAVKLWAHNRPFTLHINRIHKRKLRFRIKNRSTTLKGELSVQSPERLRVGIRHLVKKLRYKDG